jgi:hypothetical protein
LQWSRARARHHPFDTLYHAVALMLPSTMLVTADMRCFGNACHHRAIALLSDCTAGLASA